MAGGSRSPSRSSYIAEAHALHRQGRFAAALEALDRAGRDERGAVPEPLLRAALLARLGRVEEAIPIQRDAIARAEHPRARLSLATMLRSIGDIDGSIEQARAAIALAPAMGEAWWTLANIKTVPLDEADLAAMHATLARHDGDDFDRACLHFALAYALEQRGPDHSAAAWEQLVAGNALRAGQVPHEPAKVTALVDATIETFGKQFLADRAGCGDSSAAPIFIVGMPRAGSTLVEQMLAAGGEVEALGELPLMVALSRSLGHSGRLPSSSFVERLAKAPCGDLEALGRSYLAGTGPYRRTQTPRFTDKMPNNWLLTGLIAVALPRAQIVDIRRHPLDCGLSNFRENFARGQNYSYDLAHIGAYYADYVRLMTHFERLLPGIVHRVIYEQLVEDPEGELRRLCGKLGLTFSAAMTAPHLNSGPVRTASAAQVRRPLNRQAIGNWRRYEQQLAPLIEALGPVLTEWADPTAR